MNYISSILKMINGEDSADISPSPKGEDRYDNKEVRYGETVKLQIVSDNQVKKPNSVKCLIDIGGLVELAEICGDYLIFAGFGRDINIWDLKEGRHIRQLKGHRGPVIGLALYDYRRPPDDKIIVSCSGVGTILQWSLTKGDILRRFETEQVITCMGVMNDIAVIGKIDGYIELRQLTTEEAYSPILAHQGPVTAIRTQGSYACSATFGDRSCLKVWHFQFQQVACIYQIEESPDIKFSSMDICNDYVVIGNSDKPILHVFQIKTSEKRQIAMNITSGFVQDVRIVDGWIFASSANDEDAFVHVYKKESYEDVGKYRCFSPVSCIAAAVQHSEMTIVLGGESLTVLTIDAAYERLKSRNCQATSYILQDYMFKNGPTIKEKDEHEKGHVLAEKIENQPELQTSKNEVMQESEEIFFNSLLANLKKVINKKHCEDMDNDENYSHNPISETLKDVMPQTASELKNYLELQIEEQRVILKELDKSLGYMKMMVQMALTGEKKTIGTVIENLNTVKDENASEMETYKHTSPAKNEEDYSIQGEDSGIIEHIETHILKIKLN